MNPIATLLARLRAWRNNRRALKTHEEWEKVMEQPRMPRDLSEVPDWQLLHAASAWREHAARSGKASDIHDKVDDLIAEVIRLRAEQPKQTEGGE